MDIKKATNIRICNKAINKDKYSQLTRDFAFICSYWRVFVIIRGYWECLSLFDPKYKNKFYIFDAFPEDQLFINSLIIVNQPTITNLGIAIIVYYLIIFIIMCIIYSRAI